MARNAAAGVPFILDSQRVLLEVAFETPDGGVRKALAWFNMGMAAPVFSKALYRELAVDHREAIRIAIGDKTINLSAHEVVDGDGESAFPLFLICLRRASSKRCCRQACCKLGEGSPEAPPTVDGVRIGDELVAVDGAIIRGAGKDAVFSALHGKPNERRRLHLERQGAQVEVDAEVTRFD